MKDDVDSQGTNTAPHAHCDVLFVVLSGATPLFNAEIVTILQQMKENSAQQSEYVRGGRGNAQVRFGRATHPEEPSIVLFSCFLLFVGLLKSRLRMLNSFASFRMIRLCAK
jgi:hypothetical protein